MPPLLVTAFVRTGYEVEGTFNGHGFGPRCKHFLSALQFRQVETEVLWLARFFPVTIALIQSTT